MKNTSTSPFMRLASRRHVVAKLFCNTSQKFWFSFLLTLLLAGPCVYGQNCQFQVGEISGPTNACAYTGARGVVAVYAVEAIGASSFVWSIPTQATLLSGQGTSSIRVKYKRPFMSGLVSVAIASTCDGDDGETRTLMVNKVRPAMPLMVVGSPAVCDVATGDIPVTYAVAPIAQASSYSWNVPAGITLISGQGTESIQILVSPEFKADYIRVKAISACGDGPTLRFPILTTAPAKPGPIKGQTDGICEPVNVLEYSVNPYPDAISYTWTTTVPGAVITSDGPNASINFPAFVSGLVSVTANNSCGISSMRNLNIRSRGPAPAEIQGPALACPESVQTFAAETVAGATRYEWTVPDGSTIVSGNGTPTISVKIGQSSGRITVRSANSCDRSVPIGLELLVEQCEPQPPACELTIAPNPTAGPLNINWCALQEGDYHISVTDAITGCVLYCAKGRYVAGKNSISADLSNLKDGYYMVNFVTGEFNHNERIQIKHCQ